MSERAVRKILAELEKLGRRSYEIAREAIIKEKFEYTPLNEALNYFMQEWRNFHHPALLAIACEAQGGRPEETTLIGAALVLLTGAADIHDDIIDKSRTKGSKATLYGKFGEDLSILVGDALLFKGLMLLHEACEDLPKEQARTVQELVKKGFFELGAAEAKEASLKGNWKLTPEEYMDLIKRKAAVAEATASIGAVIGGANTREVKTWGRIGRTFGVLMNIKDEFVDVFEAKELKNRRDNECLPLPILYAMRDSKAGKKIFRLLKKKKLTKNDAVHVASIAMATKEVQTFKTELQNLVKEITNDLARYEKNENVRILSKLSRLALSDL